MGLNEGQLVVKPAFSCGGDLCIRRCTSADRTAIIDLLRTAGLNSWAERLSRHWEWKFEQNPFNPNGALPIWAAEVGGRMVAVTASFFVPFSIRGREQLLAWETETMVHPEYRRQGIMSRIAHEKWRQLSFTAAYANRAAFGVVNKVGVDVASTLPVALRVLDPAACIRGTAAGLWLPAWCVGRMHQLLRHRRASRLTAGNVSVSIGSWADPRTDQLWHNAAGCYDFSTVRGPAYLNWRYAQCPTHRYTLLSAERAQDLAGITVVRTVARGRIAAGYIVDMLARPDDQETIHALLAASVDHLREQGAAFVSIIATHEGWRRPSRAHGFRRWPIIPRKFFYARMDNPTPHGFSDLRLWHLTWGDCDHDMSRFHTD